MSDKSPCPFYMGDPPPGTCSDFGGISSGMIVDVIEITDSFITPF